jgi:UDP-N-acetyl-D-mannosaminuronic acid transferase (WecB/TagA/CpsF family)
MTRKEEETILGVQFHVGSTSAAVDSALRGGLILAPSGPGLAADLVESAAYREALLRADLNLTDSGFMLMLWRWRTGRRLPRLSGLGYLRALLAHSEIKVSGGTFWVMPSEQEQAIHLNWLNAQGVHVAPEDCYIAPFYAKGAIEDDDLVARICQRQPRVVVVAIGGGVQERLGLLLKFRLGELPVRPGVVCIGAAIGFLSGTQVNIPSWVDHWGLGWFWRTVSSPRRYLSRYISALGLFRLIHRYGGGLPPLRPVAQP